MRILPTVPVVAILVLSACSENENPAPIDLEALLAEPGAPAAPAEVAGKLEVPPPPLSDGVFPCSQCHGKDMPANPTRRLLNPDDSTPEHGIISRNFHHDEEHRWCLDCHSADERDKLHLASGELVSFEESYRLCGQCHGDKYRDWKAGVHGRRRGQWNGQKTYLLCVHCHNPHQPGVFPHACNPDESKDCKPGIPLRPLPAPVRPDSKEVGR